MAVWKTLDGMNQPFDRKTGFGLRELRLLSGLVLFFYISTHLLNHALGLLGLDVAERALAIAKSVWYSAPGTVVLYGAAAVHVLLALRTVYMRQHWRLPLVEYVRLGAGFSLPLLLIGHVVVTRLAFALHAADPHYAPVVSSLIRSGSEGWQLALLAPGWVHGCLGLWLSITRHKPAPMLRFAFIVAATLIPCIAAAGFLSMRSEIAALPPPTIAAAPTASGSAPRVDLELWRHSLLAAYLLCVIGAFVAGPVRRSLHRAWRKA
jgi:adenylate cyclase